MSISLEPIGFVKTNVEKVPRHWTVSSLEGSLVIDEKYLHGLKDITKGQRIVVIFHFHRSPAFSREYLLQKPRRTKKRVGVFSICSPIRPNPIGMSVLEVVERTENIIHIKGLDMGNGTPILDIKPHCDKGTVSPNQATA